MNILVNLRKVTMINRTLIFLQLAACLMMTSACSRTAVERIEDRQDRRTTRVDRRQDRYDARYNARQDRRDMRSDRADARFERW